MAQRTTNDATPLHSTIQPAHHPSAPVYLDDLSWLVGRWRCVNRQFFTRQEEIIAAAGSNLLEYFNVYFPFADETLTLKLTNNPEDRPITAEFLIRHIYEIGDFRELQGPMFEGGSVRISQDHIRYGSPVSPDLDFRYQKEIRDGRLWLVLESRSMRLELVKLFANVGDVHKSFCSAPAKEYPPDKIQKLLLRFEELKKEAVRNNGTGPQTSFPLNTNRSWTRSP